jgi:hypothetical protein
MIKILQTTALFKPIVDVIGCLISVMLRTDKDNEKIVLAEEKVTFQD